MKKITFLILACFLIVIFSSCGMPQTHQEENNDGVNVVAAMFAEYDFARQVIGEYGEVSMLMPPGTEIHSYEPTPKDIIKIKNADIFIYGGGESDTWLDTVLSSADTDELRIISMMDICELYEEETVEGMESDHVHDEMCEHEQDDDHSHSKYDEHVWTSPINAIKIIEKITEVACETEYRYSESYLNNSHKYIEQIESLHQEFLSAVENAKRNVIVFADRFPFRYFVEEYGLTYSAAFPGCSHDTEPSAKTIRYLIDKVNKEKIPVLFTIENSNENVAETIADETDAKILEFHSCHNVTKDDLEKGITYLDLMTRNLKNLKEALN